MLRFNVIICIMNELDITNAFHTYFPIKAIYNVAPQHCLCTSRVGINVADVNKKIGIKLIKPPCNRYKRRVWIANSTREKVIAYPDDCCAVRKAYRNIAQWQSNCLVYSVVGGSSPSVPIT